MKTLYLIGGPMGVGKTTVCRELKTLLPGSVFLDGDWCWDMHPFVVNAVTKAMVMDNIHAVLGNFLSCPVLEHIIFCWVMDEQTIVDEVLSGLDLGDVRVIALSLLCTEESLITRLRRDMADGIRQADILARSLQRLPKFQSLSTIKLDTTAMDAQQVARYIAAMGPSPLTSQNHHKETTP